jgi:hypothetical protein
MNPQLILKAMWNQRKRCMDKYYRTFTQVNHGTDFADNKVSYLIRKTKNQYHENTITLFSSKSD